MELIEGRVRLPRIGEVIRGPGPALPWLARDGAGREVEPVSGYLRDRMLGDISPLTCRSYAHDPLRWFRVLLCTCQVTPRCEIRVIAWQLDGRDRLERATRTSAGVGLGRVVAPSLAFSPDRG